MARESPGHETEAKEPILRLSPFNWGGFAESFFLTVATGAIATGIAVANPELLPGWMIRSVPLQVLSVLLAAVRTWKTAREERETGSLWGHVAEAVSLRGAGIRHVRDAVFEIPYVLSIALLPASAVSLQTFALCLAVFYVTDNYYNLALARGLGGDGSVQLFVGLRWLRKVAASIGRQLPDAVSSGLAVLGAALETSCSIVVDQPRTIDRVVLLRFFGRRAQLDTIAILLLSVVGLTLFGSPDLAVTAGIFVVATLLALEFLVEPFRALGLQYENADNKTDTLLWTVPHRAKLDEHSLKTLRRLHQRAFTLPERHDEIERMTDEAHSSETLLLLAEGTEVVGYVFLEVRRRAQVAFFWYLAIDEAKRRHGLGASMVRHALDVVRERWPACRAVFLETAHPTDRDDSASDAGWRLAFYQKLGFWRVRGLTYEVPAAKAAGEPSTSLRYDPMFFPLRGDGEDLSDAFVKRGVMEMARVAYFHSRPGDARWAALAASKIESCVPPPARGGAGS